MKLRFAAILGLALPGLFAASPPPAHSPAPAPAPADPKAEQKAQLQALDLEIERFDALVAKVADLQQRASAKSFLDGFKDRRGPLRAAFNHDTYVELRWEIDVEYQRLAAWVRQAGTPPVKP